MKRKTKTGPIFIPSSMTKGMDLVILSKEEYESRIKENKEIAEALKIIAEGEKEYREAKITKASSIKEALKIYERRSH